MDDQQHADELEFIEAAEQYKPEEGGGLAKAPESEYGTVDDDEEEKRKGLPCQYSRYGGGYKATSSTVQTLPPGSYDIHSDSNGIYVLPTLPPSGLLLELPEMRSEAVLSLVENFWNSEKDYKEGNDFVKGGATYKAGIMIYGPPGSGKSCTIKLVCKKLIARGGTVFFAGNNPSIVMSFLQDFARIERNRKCIVILEDIDSLIEEYGESRYLEMLDSAKTIDNALFIATTNYPEKLDPRIYNRPGRFSQIVKIGLPTPAAREAFLKAILKNHRDVETIVKNTDKFTIDHLSALVNAVYREKKELMNEIQRLRALWKMPKSTEDNAPLGLGG